MNLKHQNELFLGTHSCSTDMSGLEGKLKVESRVSDAREDLNLKPCPVIEKKREKIKTKLLENILETSDIYTYMLIHKKTFIISKAPFNNMQKIS